jgi:hypothetical protein
MDEKMAVDMSPLCKKCLKYDNNFVRVEVAGVSDPRK